MRASESVAGNIRTGRTLRDMTRDEVTEAMRELGHQWKPRTMADIESGRRSVSTDELVGLALVLGRTVPELLGSPVADLDYGGPVPLPAGVARLWLHGRRRLRIVWVDGVAKFTDLEEVAVTEAEMQDMLRRVTGGES